MGAAFVLPLILALTSPQVRFKSTLEAQVFPGLVPDRITALSMGKAVLRPIYGADLVDGHGPYGTNIVGSIWTVMWAPPPEVFGSAQPVAVHISRHNGYVVEVNRLRHPSKPAFDLYIKLFGDADKRYGIEPRHYIWR